jgi:hypothetical protein
LESMPSFIEANFPLSLSLSTKASTWLTPYIGFCFIIFTICQ